MKSAVLRGTLFAIIFFAIFVVGHLLVMRWVAVRYPLFERWNYGAEDTLITGAVIALTSGVLMSLVFWKRVR